MHRAQHTTYDMLTLRRLDAVNGLLKACTAHTSSCWDQTVAAQTVHKRLQELLAIDRELEACACQLAKVAAAYDCLQPFLQVAEVRLS